MFDIGWQELFIVAVLAIVVIGPKDLPRAVRTVMRAIRKLRSMAGEFQAGLDEVAREAELDDIRREANKIAHYDVTREIKDNLDPDGEIEKAADLDRDLRDTMTEAKNASAESTRPGADDTVTAAPPPVPKEPVTDAAPPVPPAADTVKG
ncbi:MAG: twin-arginine translocase subunit TatB [Rhodospirillales bacterium CG15_BIG_FIL_POST_REV_8_21_14_020_66_15]|nr:MAG: twin-arginine translocase subunit TatB [Rhodospirillales bacterium CG15_BIG_FIL_POST_REV_8_21_14_020_66_15]